MHALNVTPDKDDFHQFIHIIDLDASYSFMEEKSQT